MGENLADALLKTADVLHWLGKYDSANALILLSRFLRVHKVENLDDLEKMVQADEDLRESFRPLGIEDLAKTPQS